MAKRLFSLLVGVAAAVAMYVTTGNIALAAVVLLVAGIGMRLVLGPDREIVDDAHYGLSAEVNYRKPRNGGPRRYRGIR